MGTTVNFCRNWCLVLPVLLLPFFFASSDTARADDAPTACPPVANTLTETPEDRQRPLSAAFYFDATGTVEADAIVGMPFAPGPCDGIFHAPMPGQALWFRFSVVNGHATAKTWVIGFQQIIVDEAAVFELRDGRMVAGPRNGRTVPVADRADGTIKTGIPLAIGPGEERVFYLRIAGTFAPTLTPSILTPDLFEAWSTAVLLMTALYSGFIAAILLFAVVLFRHIEVRLYQYYALYMACLLVFSIVWDGWLHEFVGATWPVAGTAPVTTFLLGLGMLANTQYCRLLLRIELDSALWRYFFLFLSGIIVVATGLAMADPWVRPQPLHIVFFAYPLVLIFVALKKVRERLPQAKPVCLSLFCLMAGLLVTNYFFLFPLDMAGANSAFDFILLRPVAWGYYFGIAGEAVFMIVAISAMVKVMQAERQAAVAEAKALRRDAVAAESRLAEALRENGERIEAPKAGPTESAEAGLPPPAEQRFVERATDCLLDRIGEDGFGARELAVALGVSEKTLGRRLKQARDVTPAAFIRSVRLNFARDLIRLRRHGTVAEVAHAAGFAATGHFSKLYREEFGQLPRDALRAAKSAE
ncbi:MAG: helix-turn-helix domain-containing protein [Minwuiales bacterium]|nr:helix-turn-helix domain-containing protein [Minwuiales bacterium]